MHVILYSHGTKQTEIEKVSWLIDTTWGSTQVAEEAPLLRV